MSGLFNAKTEEVGRPTNPAPKQATFILLSIGVVDYTITIKAIIFV